MFRPKAQLGPVSQLRTKNTFDFPGIAFLHVMYLPILMALKVTLNLRQPCICSAREFLRLIWLNLVENLTTI